MAEIESLTPRQRADAAKKDRTRDKLIDAALEVMDEVGYEATAEQIIQRAGVSTATFYNFYKSRDALCRDAFVRRVVEPFETHVMAMEFEDVLRKRAAAVQELLEQRVNELLRLCDGHHDLVRAALVADLESTVETREYVYLIDFVSRALFRGIEADHQIQSMLTSQLLRDFADRQAVDAALIGRLAAQLTLP